LKKFSPCWPVDQKQLVQGLVVQDIPAVNLVTGNTVGKHSGSESVLGLVGVGIKEAQSILQLVAKTYRQVISWIYDIDCLLFGSLILRCRHLFADHRAAS
jgi:hypothetical protein